MYCVETEKVNGDIKVAFFGYDAEMTRDYFEKFVEANKENISSYIHGGIAVFKDGTLVRAIPSLIENMRGLRFDQMLLVGNSRQDVAYMRKKDIEFFENYSMNATCVPPEFQIMKINTDEVGW